MEEAYAVGRHVAHDAIIWYGAHLHRLRTEQDRSAKIIPVFEQAGGPTAPVSMSMLGCLYVDAGRIDDARRIFRDVADDRFASVPRDSTWLDALAHWSLVCTQVGTPEDAQVRNDILRPFSWSFAATTAENSGPVSLFLGLHVATIGRPKEADEWFAHAAEASERMRSIWGVHARWTSMTRLSEGGSRRTRSLRLTL